MKNKKQVLLESETAPLKKIDSRRKFIKKMVYTAPKLVLLGYISKPKSGFADFSGGPDGPPGGWTP